MGNSGIQRSPGTRVKRTDTASASEGRPRTQQEGRDRPYSAAPQLFESYSHIRAISACFVGGQFA